MFPVVAVFGLSGALACASQRNVAIKGEYPIYAEDSLMAKKQHGTCVGRAQRVSFLSENNDKRKIIIFVSKPANKISY